MNIVSIKYFPWIARILVIKVPVLHVILIFIQPSNWKIGITLDIHHFGLRYKPFLNYLPTRPVVVLKLMQA